MCPYLSPPRLSSGASSPPILRRVPAPGSFPRPKRLRAICPPERECAPVSRRLYPTRVPYLRPRCDACDVSVGQNRRHHTLRLPLPKTCYAQRPPSARIAPAAGDHRRRLRDGGSSGVPGAPQKNRRERHNPNLCSSDESRVRIGVTGGRSPEALSAEGKLPPKGRRAGHPMVRTHPEPSPCHREQHAHRIPPGRSPEGALAEGSCPAKECGAG